MWRHCQRHWWNSSLKHANADQAVSDGRIDDRTLEELFKAIDGAQTVRQNLLPEHLRSKGGNRDLFVEFIHLELPMARARSSTDANDLPFELQEFELFNMDKQRVEMFTMGEVAYAARCMIMHENENLNVAEEGVDYHVMLDWNISATDMMLGYQRDQKFICSGPFLVQRLRQIVASFIQGVELCKFDPATSTSFSISMDPQMGSIQPRPKKRLDGG